MKPMGHRLRRFIRFAVLLLAIGFVLQQIVLPAVLRRVIVHQLTSLGLSPARVQVDSASPWTIQLSDLAIGSGDRLSAAAIHIQTSPSLLSHRRVDSLLIDAPRWRIALRDGQLDLSPLTTLLSPSPASTSPSSSTSTGSPPELPFRQIELRSGRLDLDLPGWQLTIPFDASLICQSPRQWDIDFSAQIAGLPLRIQGQLDPTLLAGLPVSNPNPLQLRLQLAQSLWQIQGAIPTHDRTSVQLSLQSIFPATQPLNPPPPGTADPIPLCLIRYERNLQAGTVTLQLNPPAWTGQWTAWGQRLQARELTGSMLLTLSDHGQLHRLHLNLQAQSLAWNDQSLRDLHLSLLQDHQQVRLAAQATGPNWSVTDLEILTPSWSDLPAGPLRIQGQIACQLSQLPPTWASDLLSKVGLNLDHLDHLTFAAGGTWRRGNNPPTQAASPNSPSLPPWALHLDHARLSLQNLDLHLTQPDLQITGLSTDLQLAGTVMPGACRIQLLEPWTIAWSQFQTQQNNQPVTLSAGKLQLTQRNSPDLVRYVANTSARTGAIWSFAGDLELSNPISLKTPDIQAELSSFSLGGQATLGSTAGPTLDGRVIVQLDHLRHQPSDLTLSKLALNLPLYWNKMSKVQGPKSKVEADVPGALPGVPGAGVPGALPGGYVRVEELAIGAIKLPGLDGSVQFQDGQTEMSLTWPLLWGAVLQAKGSIDWTSPQPQGLITATIPPFKITDPQALGQLLPMLKDLEISGTFGVDAKLRWQEGRIRPTLRLDIKDSRIASSSMDVAADGIDGSISFIRLYPLMTSPNQQFTIRNAHSGKLQLTKGQVAFRIESPQSIFIERTLWTWGDLGRFWIHTFRFDPAAPHIDLEVFVENLDIRDLLTLMAQGSVQGQGLIYGRIPVTLQPGKTPFINPGEGFLYAEPGKGWFEIQDRQAVDNLLSSSDGSITDAIKLKIVQALSDFEYQSLKLEFLKENNQSLLRLEARGKGRRGEHPLEFAPLTINIRGLEEALDQLLRPRKGTTPALDAALDRNLPR